MTIKDDRARIDGLLEGQPDRPIQLSRWWAPAVELDNRTRPRRSKGVGGFVVEEMPTGRYRLRWNRWSAAGRSAKYSPGLLADFLLLENAKPERVLAYARRYGVLRICQHGLPASHSHVTPRLLFDDMPNDGCNPQPSGAAGEAWEEVRLWQVYARKFQGLLGVAQSVRAGEPPRREDRARLSSPVDEPGHTLLEKFSSATGTVVSTGPGDSEDSAAIGRLPAIRAEDIGEALTLLAAQAGIRPMVTWTSAGPALTFTGSGLFAALVMQVVLACTGAQGLAFCAGCGLAFVPSRQPHPGERAYHPQCRHISKRHAKLDYNARQRERRAAPRTEIRDAAHRQTKKRRRRKRP